MIEERAVGDLFAVDPSIIKPGAALFRGGKLVAADRIKIDPSLAEAEKAGEISRDERAKRVASAVIRWGMAYNMEPRTLVYEYPQWYDSRKLKTKGNPNDLAGVLAVGAHVSGQLSMAIMARGISLMTISPWPAEWIGNVAKSTTGDPWVSARGKLIHRSLMPDEVTLVPAKHDAVDAVGLGLWWLGRLVIHVYPGAV